VVVDNITVLSSSTLVTLEAKDVNLVINYCKVIKAIKNIEFTLVGYFPHKNPIT
jgi:hypothetical protein